MNDSGTKIKSMIMEKNKEVSSKQKGTGIMYRWNQRTSMTAVERI